MALHALLAQPVRNLVRPFGQRREREAVLLSRLLDDPKRRILLAGRDGVEIVDRPIELAQSRPAEVAACDGVVAATGEQEVARLQEFGCGARWRLDGCVQRARSL